MPPVAMFMCVCARLLSAGWSGQKLRQPWSCGGFAVHGNRAKKHDSVSLDARDARRRRHICELRVHEKEGVDNGIMLNV